MSNTQSSYCVECGKMTTFYHVDDDTWECENCGHEIDFEELGNTESDYFNDGTLINEEEDDFDEDFIEDEDFDEDFDDDDDFEEFEEDEDMDCDDFEEFDSDDEFGDIETEGSFDTEGENSDEDVMFPNGRDFDAENIDDVFDDGDADLGQDIKIEGKFDD